MREEEILEEIITFSGHVTEIAPGVSIREGSSTVDPVKLSKYLAALEERIAGKLDEYPLD